VQLTGREGQWARQAAQSRAAWVAADSSRAPPWTSVRTVALPRPDTRAHPCSTPYRGLASAQLAGQPWLGPTLTYGRPVDWTVKAASCFCSPHSPARNHRYCPAGPPRPSAGRHGPSELLWDAAREILAAGASQKSSAADVRTDVPPGETYAPQALWAARMWRAPAPAAATAGPVERGLSLLDHAQVSRALRPLPQQHSLVPSHPPAEPLRPRVAALPCR
jgi:hypothetical protein